PRARWLSRRLSGRYGRRATYETYILVIRLAPAALLTERYVSGRSDEPERGDKAVEEHVAHQTERERARRPRDALADNYHEYRCSNGRESEQGIQTCREVEPVEPAVRYERVMERHAGTYAEEARRALAELVELDE